MFVVVGWYGNKMDDQEGFGRYDAAYRYADMLKQMNYHNLVEINKYENDDESCSKTLMWSSHWPEEEDE